MGCRSAELRFGAKVIAFLETRRFGDRRSASGRFCHFLPENWFLQSRSCVWTDRREKSRGFMAHVKLHIPGPVEVSEKTFRAFCSPMIGHRGQGFKDLYAKMQPQLQQLLSTNQLVYLSTSSAWGVMEGAIRNLVSKKVLNCMCGAFSDKWLDVSKRCGKSAEALQVDWGSPIRAAEI